jgi:hypothetical protein
MGIGQRALIRQGEGRIRGCREVMVVYSKNKIKPKNIFLHE